MDDYQDTVKEYDIWFDIEVLTDGRWKAVADADDRTTAQSVVDHWLATAPGDSLRIVKRAGQA